MPPIILGISIKAIYKVLQKKNCGCIMSNAINIIC